MNDPNPDEGPTSVGHDGYRSPASGQADCSPFPVGGAVAEHHCAGRAEPLQRGQVGERRRAATAVDAPADDMKTTPRKLPNALMLTWG